VVILWILVSLASFFLRPQGSPNDFDARRHQLVAKLVVQVPIQEDDYIENEIPAVWHDAGSGTFYSIYDKWNQAVIGRHNIRKRILNYGAVMLIDLIIVLTHLRLRSLGVEPDWSANPSYRRRQRIFYNPVVYTLTVLLGSILICYLMEQIALAKSDQDVPVGAIIYDRALYDGFLASRSRSAEEWRQDLIGLRSVTFVDGGTSRGAE